MNTKLYVLGAVLGTAPALFVPELEQVPAPDAGSDDRTRGAGEAQAPRHPCELITVMKVPCDGPQETCEFTYWECPEVVNPLRA